MPERLRCQKCGVEWTYAGYPAFIGCPNCGWKRHDSVMHEEKCDKCHGTGMIQTNEVREPMYDGVQTDGEAMGVARAILAKERKKGGR